MYIDDNLIRAFKLMMDDRNYNKTDLAKHFKISPTTLSRYLLKRVDRIGKPEWARMRKDLAPFIEQAISRVATDDPLLAGIIRAWGVMSLRDRMTCLELAAKAEQAHRGK